LRGGGVAPKTTPSLRFPLGNPLKKPFQLLLVFLGCLHLAGGPYSILQGYAWIGMLVSYSQQDGIVQATKDTFSGEKPCKLCCKIADAREDTPESKDPVTPPVSPLSAKILQEMLPTRAPVLLPPTSIDLPPVVFIGIEVPADFPKASPPVPPPCRLA
jgi:hypothetical protein